MRARPVRPNIYLPVVRFGVADSDWFSVLLISCAGYLAPIPLGMTIFYVPLQMWTWLIATAGCIAFFNYVRIGRKPRWLPHKLRSLFFHHRMNRAIPNGKRKFNRPWLTNVAANADYGASERTDIAIRIIEQHRIFHDEWEERCTAPLLTTS